MVHMHSTAKSRGCTPKSWTRGNGSRNFHVGFYAIPSARHFEPFIASPYMRKINDRITRLFAGHSCLFAIQGVSTMSVSLSVFAAPQPHPLQHYTFYTTTLRYTTLRFYTLAKHSPFHLVLVQTTAVAQKCQIVVVREKEWAVQIQASPSRAGRLIAVGRRMVVTQSDH